MKWLISLSTLSLFLLLAGCSSNVPSPTPEAPILVAPNVPLPTPASGIRLDAFPTPTYPPVTPTGEVEKIGYYVSGWT